MAQPMHDSNIKESATLIPASHSIKQDRTKRIIWEIVAQSSHSSLPSYANPYSSLGSNPPPIKTHPQGAKLHSVISTNILQASIDFLKRRTMRNGEAHFSVGLMLLLLCFIVGTSTASDHDIDTQQRWRQAMMINRVASSLVFPLHGNVYPAGYYNVTLNIGQPAKPYFLDVDTGSDLTWLQCDAPCQHCTEAPHPLYQPSNKLVSCKDPLCASLQQPGGRNCQDADQCDYEVEYADCGSSLGVLVKDVFLLNFTNGQRCGYDQLPGRSNHPLDGILGLGKGISSLPSQLSRQGLVSNVVGHCLSARGGGFLVFGDDLYDSSRLTWTPMSRDHVKHYSPGPAELMFDGKSTGIRNLHVVFDSGSSYTYLNSQAYQHLVNLLKKEVSKTPLTEALDDETLPLCWKGKKAFRSIGEVNKYFKTFMLSFKKRSWRASKIQYEFFPQNYLIISSKGNACLGVLNGTEVGLRDVNVIGDVSMVERLVVYNNEKQMIGWASANCDRLPQSKSSII
ncbi:aspartic proteinase Asp1 isoform X2 [Mercurialis annua]|uniref:aspartic proteinase Asp1 isoform X2 n=1 Tax=Mercurialis annua TaxID=3986 RepID=UPI0021601F3C|nr:aspartic proteinase Asp1 isoform X2 [Mercurialis annua]